MANEKKVEVTNEDSKEKKVIQAPVRKVRKKRASRSVMEYKALFESVTEAYETLQTDPENEELLEKYNRENALLQKMEELIEPIGDNPHKMEPIEKFGDEPMKKIGDIATEVIKMQGTYDSQVNVMRSAMDTMQQGIKDLDFDKLADFTQQMGNVALNGAGKTVKGVAKVFTIFKKKEKVDENDALITEMQEALPQMLQEMVFLIENIKDADEGIQTVIAEAAKLGQARVAATYEINVYLATAQEILTRYDEDYIPEAEDNYNETGDPLDETVLRHTKKRKKDFMEQILSLQSTAAASVIAEQQLEMMISTMEDQRKKVRDILNKSQNEWKAQLATAGIAGSTLKVGQMLKKADEFGDKMQKQTTGMIKEAHRMTEESKRHGTIDPAVLAQTSRDLVQMIEEQRVNEEKRMQEIVAKTQELQDVQKKLIAASDAMNDNRAQIGSSDNPDLTDEQRAEREAKRAEKKAQRQKMLDAGKNAPKS